ncbi:hypothetical protein ACN38_g13232, partial [Penicillium nordicum]
CIELYGYHG